jgi:hypothetical protein
LPFFNELTGLGKLSPHPGELSNYPRRVPACRRPHTHTPAQVFVLSTHPSRELRFVSRQSWSRWNLGARPTAGQATHTHAMPAHVQQAVRCGTTRLAVRKRSNGDRAGGQPHAPHDKFVSTPFLHPGRGWDQRELPLRGPRRRILPVDVVRAAEGTSFPDPDSCGAGRVRDSHCDFGYARRNAERETGQPIP